MCLPQDRREAFFSQPPQSSEFTEALDHLIGELGSVMSKLTPEMAETLIKELESAPRIFGYGGGRSGYILRGFCMRLMHLGFEVFFVGETITPRLQPQDLLLVMSGSGETAHTVDMVRRANGAGARTLALTAQPHSSIGRTAQVVLAVPGTTKLTLAQEPASVQCPGSLFEQATFLFLETVVLILFKHRLNQDQDQILSRHTDLE